MTFKIEKAEPTDVPAIKEIEIAAGLSSWSAEDYRLETQRTDSIFLVCRETASGAVAGFLLARLITQYNIDSDSYKENSCPPSNALDQPSNAAKNGSSIELYNIGVIPEYRRRGVGSRLLDALLGIGAEKSAGEVMLEVRKANAGAIRFYEKFGFRSFGERRNFYANPTDDAVLMRRRNAPREGRLT